MRKYFSIILLLVMAIIFVGCTEITSGSEFNFADENEKGKKTVLTVWMDDTDGTFVKDKVKPAFEAKYPYITVEFQHMSTVDAREKLKTYGKANYGADVFQFPHDHMAQAILDDLVYVLPNDLKTRLEDRMLPVALNIATSCYDDETKSFECTSGTEKKLFAVPISIESVTLYYNKDLVQDENLPTTFEELLQDAVAYAQDPDHLGQKYFASGSHWADAYFLQFIYGAFGWNPFGPNLNDATSVGFADQKSRDAIDWMINTLKPVVTGEANHDSIAGSTLFEEGKLPFILTGPWSTETFRGKVNYGAITIPTINGNQVHTFAGAQMVAVYKYSKNIDAAVKFVEFLQSDEVAKMLFETAGDCPALKNSILDTIPEIKNSPIVQVMLEQLKTSVPMPTIPEVTYYWGPAESMMKNIWNSNKDIDDETTNAERAYNAAKQLAS